MSEPNANKAGAGNHAGALIYVVDDEPMLLELASVILEPLGYRIETFRDPGVAVRSFKAASPPPALMVTDYAMHTMNGMDLIEQCKRIEPNLRVLLISGTVDETIYENSSVKPNRFLAKPYLAKELVEAVQSLLAE
jgi:two-component system cell cycle sensor histidine kinase/response regulator CckA